MIVSIRKYRIRMRWCFWFGHLDTPRRQAHILGISRTVDIYMVHRVNSNLEHIWLVDNFEVVDNLRIGLKSTAIKYAQ